jgi:O-antigen/teichoic acid export membrane protein
VERHSGPVEQGCSQFPADATIPLRIPVSVAREAIDAQRGNLCAETGPVRMPKPRPWTASRTAGYSFPEEAKRMPFPEAPAQSNGAACHRFSRPGRPRGKASANRELRHSFTWRTLAAAGGMVSTLLLSVVVVRNLDPAEAATFFAILAALAFGPKIGCLGMGPNIIRLLPSEPDPLLRRQLAGTHLRASLLLSAVSAPLIAFVGCNALIGHSDFLPVFVLATVLIVIESLRLMLSDIFAAVGRVRASVATMHYVRSMLVLPFVTLVLVVMGRSSLLWVVSVYLVVALVQFVFALVASRHHVAVFGGSFTWSTMQQAIGQGAQLASLDLSEFLVMQGTIWLATATLNPVAATQYAAAVTLAMQVTVLESLAALAASAPAARLWAAGKKDQVVRMLSNASTLSTVVVLVFVALLAVFGPYALELAYGPGMRPAATMLLIIAIGGICQAFCKSSMIYLMVSGHLGAAARTATLVTVAAIGAAVAAVLLSGPFALAVVTSVSVAATSLFQWLTARVILGRAPNAHFHVLRAARELASDRDGEASDADSGDGGATSSRAA